MKKKNPLQTTSCQDSIRRKTIRTTISILMLAAGLLATITASDVGAQNAIVVGGINADPSTVCCLGLSLPIISGDQNYNASAAVWFRKSGTAIWQAGLPLFRVRPETVSGASVIEQFAGSIFDLEPGTSYDVRVFIIDPDGGDTTQTATLSTYPLPLDNPTNPNIVNVSTVSELKSAFSNANPGDVITLAAGTYNSNFTINKNGTAQNPIFIRGVGRDSVVIDANGSNVGFTIGGRYVTLEHLTIRNSNFGIQITASNDVAIRYTRLTDVQHGVWGPGLNRMHYYISDNIMEGNRAVWPDTSQNIWSIEGIQLTGQGHTISYNTMSGFGDSMGFTNPQGIPNLATDFYNNEILWGGDDGIEADKTTRNVRVFRNRITNGGHHGISTQPLYGGPLYIFQNVIYNVKSSPFKLNNNPSGDIVVNNTSVKSGYGFASFGAQIANLRMYNNIFIADPSITFTGDRMVEISAVFPVSTSEMDYNGYKSDGSFRFSGANFSNFAALKSDPRWENNGRLLTGTVFQSAVTIPNTPTIFRNPIDAALSPSSNAIDAGIVFNQINDNYTGSAPDLGARELGGIGVSGRTPSITTQPQNQSVTEGQIATFSVTAIGTPPLSYQWQKDGVAITGATNNSYTTPATTQADNGSVFTVVVSNSEGSVTSNPATLTVQTPVLTTVTVSPASAKVEPNQTRQFNAQGLDQFSNPFPITPVWTVSGGGTVDQTGLFTAGVTEGGPFTVTATVVSVAGTATVTVIVSIMGLVVLYDFNEGTGSVVSDVSGVGT
ncbi:MAG: immunoglobulin domain-containing protein, partial [Candidatus Poribacteria bacterium]|nr:immunoglobulin domain-containing protein [Candidatus Poribacteria bacterium]